MNEIDFTKLPYEVVSGIVDTFFHASPLDQLIFYGRTFHNFKYREIAEVIDMSLQSVGMHYKTFTSIVQCKYEHAIHMSGSYLLSLDDDPVY